MITGHCTLIHTDITLNTAHLTLLTGQYTLFTPFQLDPTLMWQNSTHLLSPTIPDELFAPLQLALFITNYTLVFKLYWMYNTTKIIPNMVHFWEKEKNMSCLFCLVLNVVISNRVARDYLGWIIWLALSKNLCYFHSFGVAGAFLQDEWLISN